MEPQLQAALEQHGDVYAEPQPEPDGSVFRQRPGTWPPAWESTGPSQQPVNFGPPTLSFTNFSEPERRHAEPEPQPDGNFQDAVTYVARRKHNLSFGFIYNRLQQDSQNYQNARGSFAFSGLLTSQLDANGQPVKGTGFDFADFLLGFPQSSSLRFASSNNYFRSWSTAAYAQDDSASKPA